MNNHLEHNIRYNTLDDRLYNTRNPITVDSDDVVNTVDFRRKLLRFDSPSCNEKPHVQYTIPRYYSEFRPWFHQCFQFQNPQKHCVSEYKEIEYKQPIIEVVSEPVNPINYNKITLILWLMIIIMIILLK